MGADDDLAALADELYGLPPEDFTAARDAAAKAAGGPVRTAVKGLRRPTTSAWLVNCLARDEPDLLDSLLQLGPALAEAQAAGSGADLRALGQQRRELVAAVTSTAVEGRDVTAAVRTEVEQTLEAALADPSAAEAVRSGTLVRALSFAGFGGVDVEGAVAVAGSRPARATSGQPGGPPDGPGTAKKSGKAQQKSAGTARRLAAAEQRALDAAAALDDAVRACESAQHTADDAATARAEREQERETVQAEVDDLEQRLSAARERLAEAGHRAHDAQTAVDKAAQARDRAQRRVVQAQEEAEAARAALDALRRA